MKNILRIAAFLLALTGVAQAQSTGQLQAGQTWGNPSASKAPAGPTTVGALIDRSISCSAQGDIIYRGASLWSCLAPGTAGLPVVSGGAGANLVYSTLANAALANSAVTVNGTTCTLGSTCTPTSVASSMVVPTTTISGGSTGRVLYDNAGALGEMTTTGSGTVLALATSPVFTTPTLGVASATNVVASGLLQAGATIGISGDLFLTRAAAAAWQVGAADAVSPIAQSIQAQSVAGGTSNTAGVDWTRISSKGTGTAASGNLVDKTGFSFKSGSATLQHSTTDRKITVAKGKVLTDATPVSLFEVALPTLSMAGGQIEATVVCTDGTDMQSFTQIITYSAVNKGGVYTKSITATTGDKSVTGGSTLVNTWSILDGTNKVTIQLSSDTSLVPSTNAFMVYYSVKNNSEQATTIQ